MMRMSPTRGRQPQVRFERAAESRQAFLADTVGDFAEHEQYDQRIRRGCISIQEDYERLFKGSANARLELYDFTQQSGADGRLFVGRERSSCIAPTVHVRLRIRTTRWFVRSEGAWRQLHHHGSIEAPGLLADYQRPI
jgi:SnoaL-like domain